MMAGIHQVTSNFTSGELSPFAYGRIDKPFYYNGAKRLYNVLPKPQGGFIDRPALEYMADLGIITDTQLIEFDFNKVQTYTISIYDSNAKIFKDGVLQSTEVSPYPVADLGELTWVQSGDTLLLFHPDHPTQQLVRGISHTDWTLAAISWTYIPRYPFTPSVANPATTLTPSAVSGNINLVAGAAAFAASDLGGYIVGNGGTARITKFVSTTKVDAIVIVEFFDTTAIASGQWDLEQGYEDVWSVTRGYPRSGTFHQGRLWIGGSKERPHTTWGSVIGAYFDFDPGNLFDDDGLDFTMDTDQVHHIRNMISAHHLQIFTSGAEFYVPRKSAGIVPGNFEILRQDKRGSSFIRPLFIDGSTLFHQVNSNIYREYLFSDIEQRYNANNINILADHILNSPVDAARQSPGADFDSDLIYVVNTDGTWAVLISVRDQQVTIWVTGGTPNGKVKSVAFDETKMYVAVERTIDAVTKIYLERFNFAKKLDSSIMATGGPTAWTGLGHLEGETVTVLGDGLEVETGLVISAGALTTTGSYTTLEVGYDPLPEVELLTPEVNLADGPMKGRIKRIIEVKIDFLSANNCQINGYDVSFLLPNEAASSATPALQEVSKSAVLKSYAEEGNVTLKRTFPATWKIRAISQKVSV